MIAKTIRGKYPAMLQTAIVLLALCLPAAAPNPTPPKRSVNRQPLGSCLVRGWMGSLEYKAAPYDPSTDMASPDRTGPKIYVLWHEYLLFPLYLRGNCSTTLLVSRHRDAEIAVPVGA